MHKDNEIIITPNDIDFYIRQAQNLALDYDSQYKMLGELGDYITEDIASDWLWTALKKGILKLYENNYISENVVRIYEEIDHNFYDVSMDGKYYDEKIWTLEALRNHPFWEKQRQLAKQVLKELEKIRL